MQCGVAAEQAQQLTTGIAGGTHDGCTETHVQEYTHL